MARRDVLVATTVCLFAAACTQTTRVSGDLTTESLGQTKKAVAVMRVGAASPNCINVAVLLGVRDGEVFRRHQAVTVANVRSATEPAVAEIELDPGEYHVLAYSCASARKVTVLADKADAQTYRSSYAFFTLQPGEVVNVGYLHVGASRVGRSAFGRPLRVDIDVTDWPLAELDRFKARRPAIYAQMTTRLMTVTPRGPVATGKDDCDRLRALQAEGKVQELPPECAQQAKAKRPPAAVAKLGGNL